MEGIECRKEGKKDIIGAFFGLIFGLVNTPSCKLLLFLYFIVDGIEAYCGWGKKTI